jgi:hypothetical protein
MASDVARQYLERLQEAVYAALGKPPPAAEAEARRKSMEGFLQRATEAGAVSPEALEALRATLDPGPQGAGRGAVPTRFEDPVLYGLLVKLADEVESAATALSLPLPPRPLLGTLPTGQVNAMTVLVPGTSEHLVIFESQLFLFALLFSKAVVRALPFERDGDGWVRFSAEQAQVRSNIEQDREVLQRFLEVLLAYVVHGAPAAAPQYFPPEPYQSFAAILRDSMELFVLGHEYGHIIEGHLGMTTKSAALLGDQEVDRVTYSWQQELEADKWGLQLMIPAMQRSRQVDLGLSFWGADFFFSSVDVVRKAIAVLRTGREETVSLESHPPPDVRREVVRRVLASSLPDDAANGAISLGKMLETVIGHLWTLARPSFQRLHEQGGRPSASWG